MAARHKKSSVMVQAKPGSIPPTQFPGKDVMVASKKGSNGFKKGGKVADKDRDGMASGGGVAARMDKPRRASGGQIGVIGAGMAGDTPPKKATGGKAAGGAVHKARGGAATMRGRSPMSSAANVSMPAGKTTH